jgi:hypothetical protein
MTPEKILEVAKKFTTYYPSSFSVGYWPFSNDQLVNFVQEILKEDKNGVLHLDISD